MGVYGGVPFWLKNFNFDVKCRIKRLKRSEIRTYMKIKDVYIRVKRPKIIKLISVSPKKSVSRKRLLSNKTVQWKYDQSGEVYKVVREFYK